MIIRWLGAFGHGSDLQESINFELSRSTIACAEEVKKGANSGMHPHIRLGLLISQSGIVRRWSSDVWSEYKANGKRLRKTRDEGEAYSGHNEIWVNPNHVIGFILRAGGPAISASSLNIIKLASKKYRLPIYKLNRAGELLKVRIS
jgi:hypothetical protein